MPMMIQTSDNAIVIKSQNDQDQKIFAIAQVIAVDNRVMISFPEEEKLEISMEKLNFINAIDQAFGGKVCVLDPCPWLKFELQQKGFMAHSGDKGTSTERFRITNPQEMREKIDNAIMRQAEGYDSLPNESLLGKKIKDSFSQFDRCFNILTGQKVAERSAEVAQLAQKSNFRPELIERCQAAGSSGFKNPNAVAIELADSHELVAYVSIDGETEYGYFGNTFIDSDKFFGGGRQAGAAYLYHKALEIGVFSKYKFLLVVAPEGRVQEYEANFACKPLEPAAANVLIHYSNPIGLREQLQSGYEPSQTRYHQMIFQASQGEEFFENYIDRLTTSMQKEADLKAKEISFSL